MAENENNAGLGCLWLIALVLFVPAGYIAAAIWPDQTANQFVGRTFLIGLGLAAAVLVIGITALRKQHR